MEKRHYLVGTAGHVDHGKTELIRALSGINTDRLKEEQQRGISIELGFAHAVLPSGREIGIVDVPGHERFVRQMLAGAAGMDLVLLVIAADEGTMPQTREHLDILTLLGIERGIVVLNKIDLVDEEWLELVKEEVREDLKDSVFAGCPLCCVSAQTGEGIAELKQEIDRILDEAVSKNSNGPVRLPLDRVFSIQGFGTVATGTLYSGTLKLGQDVVIEPVHRASKVRSLQVHGQKVEQAVAGQRVAVNLAGLEVAEVAKGAVLATPGSFSVGTILDTKVQALASAGKSIVQRQRLRFHLGTAEILGRIHLLDHDELNPSDEGYAQILLESPVLAAAGDRFVLRFYSPAHTIAGGKVLAVAQYKHKRYKDAELSRLRLMDQGNPLDLLERELNEPRTSAELSAHFHLPPAEIAGLIKSLREQERLEESQLNGQTLYWSKAAASAWRTRLTETVERYVSSFPLRRGVGREELKTRLGVTWNHQIWQSILEAGAVQGLCRFSGGKVLPREDAPLPIELAKRLACLSGHWLKAGLAPPDLESVAAECKIRPQDALEYAQFLCESGKWTVASGVYFDRAALEEAESSLVKYLKEHGEVSVGEARALWQTSRKYAVPLLEYFDQKHVTRRQGDKRTIY